MTVTDPATGAARSAEIFIAVMGASNMTYAEASWSPALPGTGDPMPRNAQRGAGGAAAA